MKSGDCGQRTSRHEFIGDAIRDRPVGTQSRDAFRTAVQTWRIANARSKAKARNIAKASNCRTKMLKLSSVLGANRVATDAASLWDVSRGSPYGLHPADVRQALRETRGIQRRAGEWHEAGSLVVKPDESFPSVVTYCRKLHPSLIGLAHETQERVNNVVDALRVLLGTRGIDIDIAEPLLIGEAGSGRHRVVKPCSVAKSPEFALECAAYLLAGQESPWMLMAEMICPLGLVVQHGVVLSATALALSLVALGPGPYEFHRLSLAREVRAADAVPGALHIEAIGVRLDIEDVRKTHLAKAPSNDFFFSLLSITSIRYVRWTSVLIV